MNKSINLIDDIYNIDLKNLNLLELPYQLAPIQQVSPNTNRSGLVRRNRPGGN